MLFRKKIERSCLYCSFGTKLDEDSVLCTKRGVVNPDIKCRKFRYEPYKRIPSKENPLDFKKYDKEDFSL